MEGNYHGRSTTKGDYLSGGTPVQIKYQTPRRVYDIASSLLWHTTKIIIILTERGDHCVGDC